MKLSVAEDFFSIQGEGKYIGYPALFIRLAGCNLMCGGMGTQFDKELHDATWRCDTIEVWMKGKSKDTQEYTDYIRDTYKQYLKPNTHIIVTGGEPTMQQEAIVNFLNSLKRWNYFIEIETNATIVPTKEFNLAVDHYNLSPKLSNSGNPKSVRLVPHALEYFSANPKSTWKFVISNEDDLKEAEEDFILPYHLNRFENVWLMPSASTQKEYEQNAPLVAELCKEKNYKFSSRLQVNIWNETTGV
jgi:7-carboxy-7-deazaguanine synthase